MFAITSWRIWLQQLVNWSRSRHFTSQTINWHFCPKVMFRSIPSALIPPGNLSGICLLISKLWQMPHGWASLRVQMAHGGASERVQMTNLWNKKTIIPHKLTYFLTAKTAPFLRTMLVFLFVIPRSHWKQLCKYLHLLEWIHKLLLKFARLSCFWQCPTPGLTFFGKCPTEGKEKWKNARRMPGGMGEP